MMQKPRWVDIVEGDWDIDLDSQVHSALLTTYEPPNGDFLIEELFPSWFGLDNKKSSNDDTSFVSQVRVMDALKARRDRIAIFFSSTPQGEEAKHWVWSHLRTYPVGSTESMTQHSKLWMLHRIRSDGSEWLDLRVSSTNLTQSALDGQLQSGIRIVAKLDAKPQQENLRSWGILSDFLRELAKHSGPEGQAGVAPFLALLSRATAPKGVQFIASVPGKHSGAAWGVRSLGAALKRPGALETDIFVPTVGRWRTKELRAWCAALGVQPKNIRLAWIRDGHEWTSKWAMPSEALNSVKEVGAQVVTAPTGEGFPRKKLHNEFVDEDKRWSHAKVYWFGRGPKMQALVTSANWSTSAWGRVEKDHLKIENFELGVLFPVSARPLSDSPALKKPPAIRDEDDRNDDPGTWAYATFDGKRLTIYLRTARPLPKKIVVTDVNQRTEVVPVSWRQTANLHTSILPWAQKVVPSFISLFFSDGENRWVSILDLRASQDAEKTPLSRPMGLSGEELKRMLAALLEEHYGGEPLETITLSGNGKINSKTAEGSVPHGYGVEALELGRKLTAIVDAWAEAIDDAKIKGLKDLRERVVRDGRRMLDAWRTEIGAQGPRAIPLAIAADDLEVRLEALS